MRLYHYLETKWALDDIRRRRLKISKIDDMNDPYEFACVRSTDERSQAALDLNRDEVCKCAGVLCFSRSWSSVMMWSHYGDRHKGVVLGFDVSDEELRPVDYDVQELTVVGDLNVLPTREQLRLVNLLCGGKYSGWIYEKEVRVNAKRADMDEETGLYFADFNEKLKLKEVIAGVRFPMSRRPIEEALKGYPEHVEIIKAGRSDTGFEIVVDERGLCP